MINRDASGEVLDGVVPTARALGTGPVVNLGRKARWEERDVHKDGFTCLLGQLYPRLLSSFVIRGPESPQFSSDDVRRPRVRVVNILVERREGALDPQIDEPEVVVGEGAIVVI